MYNLHDYGSMIADKIRMAAYARALREAVRPRTVVLDLGAGAGIFALLACRFGARRVYAVEPDSIIEIGREIASANGYADRIVFIQKRCESVDLNERVDLIVSDLRGVLPYLENHLSTVIDARTRLLAPGGVLIGRRDTLWTSIVAAPELYRTHFAGWDDDGLGFDQLAGRRIQANIWRKGRVRPDQLLTKPVCWATIDFETLTCTDVGADVVVTLARPGLAHGLIVWFDADLAEGVRFSNAPDQPETIYGSAFFPWPEPLLMRAGDVVAVTLGARLAGDEYVWSWDSAIHRQGGDRLEFRQTTLLGGAASPAILRRRAIQHKPVLDEDGEIDRFILSAMNGRVSVRTIARRLMARFPARFAGLPAAATRVGDISARYAR